MLIEWLIFALNRVMATDHGAFRHYLYRLFMILTAAVTGDLIQVNNIFVIIYKL